MKVIVVGATGTIGKALVENLEPFHEIIKVGFSRGDYTADITSKESIEKMFERIGNFDALISTTGDARFGMLDDLNDTDFEYSLRNKLLGQINLFLIGKRYAKTNGSFTLTSGMLAQHPIIGSSIVSMVNAGLESFVKAASLELEDLRLNIVSPVFAKETMEMMGMDSTNGVPAVKFAKAYKEALESSRNGEVLHVQDYL
mgnify:CR=1 FL=1